MMARFPNFIVGACVDARAMTTDADEETIDAIETFGLAGADADAIARGECGTLWAN